MPNLSNFLTFAATPLLLTPFVRNRGAPSSDPDARAAGPADGPAARRYPLLLYLHGAGESGSQEEPEGVLQPGASGTVPAILARTGSVAPDREYFDALPEEGGEDYVPIIIAVIVSGITITIIVMIAIIIMLTIIIGCVIIIMFYCFIYQ